MNKNWVTICLNNLRKNDRFTEKLGKDVLDFIKNYEKACLDYNLLDVQQLCSFHNLFDEEAKHFYRNKVQPICKSYRLANVTIIAHYSNFNRLNGVRQYLQTVTMENLMSKES